MDGTDIGHTRQKPSSFTLPPSAPVDVALLIPGTNEAMGEPGPEEYAINKFSQIGPAKSVRGFEEHGKADSLALDEGFEHDETRKRFSTDDLRRFSIDELTAYDLHPPPPTVSDANAEYLASRLYSAEHLDVILKDSQHSQRFRSFINTYHPQSAPTLVRYLESQKALAAIRYANALADVVSSTRSPDPQRTSRSSSERSDAAVVDTQFQNFSRKAVDELVTEALPAYITYRMITLVTESLVKEITGTNSPIMRDLVQGLAEVYCLSDPNQPDNPLVFASEEFYSTTQYNHEYVIGKNCRFLQGPGTQRAAVRRISNALRNGQEINELLLNYRRDGSAFLNLVLMAPLMDQRGNIRYHIGAQIDVSRLLEGGRGLESFKQLLDQERDAAIKATIPDLTENKPSLKMLRELGGLLNAEEADIIRHRSVRRGSMSSTASTPTRSIAPGRRFVGMEEPADNNLWPPTNLGPSGRLPGVYQNYLLVRPYPSLRIIFTSPALRIPGLSQSKLMDRIGGPTRVREGLMDALAQGTSVTAKVSWLTQSNRSNGDTDFSDDASTNTQEPESYLESRPRWIHCTPLLGSDSKPGVYMIVMVDKEEITGTLHARTSTIPVVRSRDLTKEMWPFRGVSNSGNSAARFSSTKLYADYLKREGQQSTHTQRRKSGPSLEEDIRLGRVNSGLARVNPRAETLPSEVPSSRCSGVDRHPSRHSHNIGSSPESRHPHDVGSMSQSRHSAEVESRPQSCQLRDVEERPPSCHPSEVQGKAQSRSPQHMDLSASSHFHSISMGVGPPTPRKRSTITELDIASNSPREGI